MHYATCINFYTSVLTVFYYQQVKIDVTPTLVKIMELALLGDVSAHHCGQVHSVIYLLLVVGQVHVKMEAPVWMYLTHLCVNVLMILLELYVKQVSI